MSNTTKARFTAKKALFLNMKEDNLILRAATFKNKKTYSRKNKSWKRDI